MAEVRFNVSKSDIKTMEDAANQILKSRGLNPDVVRYEQNLKIVAENAAKLVKKKEIKTDVE